VSADDPAQPYERKLHILLILFTRTRTGMFVVRILCLNHSNTREDNRCRHARSTRITKLTATGEMLPSRTHLQFSQ
jgi:hypothetical protein